MCRGRHFSVVIVLVIVGLLSAGCGLIDGFFEGRTSASDLDIEPPSPTFTATAVVPCAFMWATQPRPDLEDGTTVILESVLNYDFVVGVSLYGETCGSAFLAMTTDFVVDFGAFETCSTETMTIAWENIADRLTAAVTAGEIEYPARLGWLELTCEGKEGTVWVREMIRV